MDWCLDAMAITGQRPPLSDVSHVTVSDVMITLKTISGVNIDIFGLVCFLTL